MEKIDFVIPWVDGNDPEWQRNKSKWEGKDDTVSNSADGNTDCRYRENGFLRYWFRGVEKYAPWVNTIHFVTCGQKPEWLNESHPKLHLVSHEDYIPKEYLPTFNSNTIELNYHRIEELSEHFVLFNDDVFLLRPVEPTFFFKNGQPVLKTSLQYKEYIGYNNWSRVVFNDYCVVNNAFDIPKAIWQNRKKWFSIKDLGPRKAKNNLICYYANRTLPVSAYGHVALPHLKSTLQELWERQPEVMHQSSIHKFRSDDQVNQWLLCAWNQAKGNFFPVRENRLGQILPITPQWLEKICWLIENQATAQLCVNDSSDNTEPERCQKALKKAFESILPEKSSFEKY